MQPEPNLLCELGAKSGGGAKLYLYRVYGRIDFGKHPTSGQVMQVICMQLIMQSWFTQAEVNNLIQVPCSVA